MQSGYGCTRGTPPSRSVDDWLVRPTERGRAAERVIGATSARVDAMLTERLGTDAFESFCAGLLTLAERRTSHGHPGDHD